jgi:hypothetical protein
MASKVATKFTGQLQAWLHTESSRWTLFSVVIGLLVADASYIWLTKVKLSRARLDDGINYTDLITDQQTADMVAQLYRLTPAC